MPAIIPTIATTITISISVTPRLLFPARDVGIDSVAARLSIRAVRHDIRLVPMVAGEFVEVRMAPGVVGNIHLQVWSGPLRRVCRRHSQRLQSLLAGGEDAGI